VLLDRSIPNKTVLNILELLDDKPQVPKPVIFKFSSEEEGLLYRLAAVLKKREYIIVLEKVSRYRWHCIAKRHLYPDEEPLDSLCIRMVQLADTYDVIFDGWEVAIQGEKSG
jgi:hypothetical protein